MKSYEEVIQSMASAVSPGGRLRYYGWAAYVVIAEIYDKAENQVHTDIAEEVEFRINAEKVKRKQEQRESNEARRLANLANGGRKVHRES